MDNCKDVGFLIMLRWVDSASNDYWQSNDEIDLAPVECSSVGYVIKETEDYIVLAQTIGDNNNQACNRTAIPKGCIKLKQRINIENEK